MARKGTGLYTATARGAPTTVRTLLIAGALLVAVGPLPAQQQPAPDAAVVDTTPLPGGGRAGGAVSEGAVSEGVVSTGDFVRMVVVLAAVLGAIYLLFRLIRRGAAGRLANSELIAVLGSRSLGGNRSLHLVRAGRGYYLVGAGDQAANLVAEITDPDSVDLLAAHSPAHGGAARGRFRDLLAEAGIGAAPDTGSTPSGHTGFLRQQRDRVRGIGGASTAKEDTHAAS